MFEMANFRGKNGHFSWRQKKDICFFLQDIYFFNFIDQEIFCIYREGIKNNFQNN